jgi:molybdenum cofactor cytidylyltransferase
MTESRLGIVILAAGEARRFGACKQLALFHKKPLLQHVIDAALPLRHARLVVMTGKYHEAIAAASDEGSRHQRRSDLQPRLVIRNEQLH